MNNNIDYEKYVIENINTGLLVGKKDKTIRYLTKSFDEALVFNSKQEATEYISNNLVMLRINGSVFRAVQIRAIV